MQFYQFIFLKRQWDQDQVRLKQSLLRLTQNNEPLWFLLFPEGTVVNPKQLRRAEEYAQRHHIAVNISQFDSAHVYSRFQSTCCFRERPDWLTR
jgi:hypothetical protein